MSSAKIFFKHTYIVELFTKLILRFSLISKIYICTLIFKKYFWKYEKCYLQYIIGSLILFEMVNDQERVDINNLPESFPDPAGNSSNQYKLIGLVKYYNSILEKFTNITNKENKQSKRDKNFGVGHYMAVCKRNTKWLEYNDVEGTQRHLNKKKDQNLFIGIIIYAKVSI